LLHRGLQVEREKPIPVRYKENAIECGYRVDLLVEDMVVVEVKAVERLDPIHSAQLLTYLKLSRHTIGLLINFNVPLLKDGIRRLVLGHADAPRPLRTLR
jgi:GxxExxY protein